MSKLRNLHQSKKGVASLYAVIFATILFGVITLSFVRIILSEATQSGDDELSQSAYDSALAGVEDAKRAVNAYYACLNSGGANCQSPFDEDCEAFSSINSNLKGALGYQDAEGEIKIQESSTAVDRDGETVTDQAYTCVTMSTKVEDYRSTLTKDTRVKVVPLGIESSDLNKVATVEFKWFSENNGTNVVTSGNLYEEKSLKDKNHTSKVPVMSLTLLHTSAMFNIADFNNSTAENYSTMILLPGTGEKAVDNTITAYDIKSAGNSDSRNEPFLVDCKDGDFACTVKLKTDGLFTPGGNALLIVSMPYGETISDFAVTMYDAADNVISFNGAQVSVDSTGRANQLYRRVETRLDPADSYFPYPQFAAELDGDSDSKLLKNFWITYNCWTQGGECPNNGELSTE